MKTYHLTYADLIRTALNYVMKSTNAVDADSEEVVAAGGAGEPAAHWTQWVEMQEQWRQMMAQAKAAQTPATTQNNNPSSQGTPAATTGGTPWNCRPPGSQAA